LFFDRAGASVPPPFSFGSNLKTIPETHPTFGLDCRVFYLPIFRWILVVLRCSAPLRAPKPMKSLGGFDLMDTKIETGL
jgi:hypothetical protein